MIDSDLLTRLEKADKKLCDKYYSHVGLTYSQTGTEIELTTDDLLDEVADAWLQHCLQDAIRKRG